MTLSFFITVIPGHDKPQPPGCLLGSVARPGEFPIAMCDRGTWQIIYNLRELADFYNSIGARIKETWIENGERVFQETSNGMVRLGRRRCTITY